MYISTSLALLKDTGARLNAAAKAGKRHKQVMVGEIA